MQSRRVVTPDGIEWHVDYVEPSPGSIPAGQQEYLLMIPSGEGDCHSLGKVASLIAAQGRYHVITFDMPGFSRSTAPLDAYKEITPRLVAGQIVALMEQLGIKKASFWGSSSGGGAALALVGLYPERVKCAIVHEVPFAIPGHFAEISKQSDEELSQKMQYFFSHVYIEEENDGRQKWEALGAEYHKRLEKNYVTWLRHLGPAWIPGTYEVITPENVKKRPVFWTVGSLNKDESRWQGDFDMAESTGTAVDTKSLPCLHFPHVTVPELMATYLIGCIEKVGD